MILYIMLCLITFGITYGLLGTSYILKDDQNIYIKYFFTFVLPGWLMGFLFVFFIPKIFFIFKLDIEGDLFKIKENII